MSRTPQPGPADLPPVIPIFPLAGVLLLPGCRLPLNIFEPRYVSMTRDALDGHGLIGMVQPTDPNARAHAPPVYANGCAGRIVEHRDTPDGRILLMLAGLARFRIVEELAATTLYRQVHTDWQGFPADFEEPPEGAVDRPALLSALRRYLDRSGIPADWSAIEAAPDSALVDCLAMICPFQPSEKQALLEAPDLAARARLMASLMEMATLAGGVGRPQ